MSKFCTNCGQSLPDEARFCNACGQAMDLPKPEPAAYTPAPAPIATPEPVAQPIPQPVAQPIPQPVAQPIPQPIPAQPVAPAAPANDPWGAAPAQPAAQPVQPAPAYNAWDSTVAEPVQSYAQPYTQPAAPQPEKKKLNIKVIALAVIAAIVVGLGAWFVINLFTNTYETPLKLYMEVRNAKKYDFDDQYKSLNGFAKKEYKDIMELYKKSSDYDSDRMKDSFNSNVEALKEQYGDDYKFSYEIEDKDKLDKDELEECEDELKEAAKAMQNQYKNLDSDELEDMADEFGISESQAKKLVKAMEAFAKKLKDAKITAGYELNVTYIITGSKLDEPIENEQTIYVYKVDGRWICFEHIDMF